MIGSSRSHWSCYFFPETSQECRVRAFDLMKSKEAWDNKIITLKENYTSKAIWAGRVPRYFILNISFSPNKKDGVFNCIGFHLKLVLECRVWGEPWSYLQPTTDIDGNLLLHHRKMDRRWWRAQVQLIYIWSLISWSFYEESEQNLFRIWSRRLFFSMHETLTNFSGGWDWNQNLHNPLVFKGGRPHDRIDWGGVADTNHRIY